MSKAYNFNGFGIAEIKLLHRLNKSELLRAVANGKAEFNAMYKLEKKGIIVIENEKLGVFVLA